MITIDDYVGKWKACSDWIPERQSNAEKLLSAVNNLMRDAEADGIVFKRNPMTGTLVSGQTMGGFRPQSCTQGATHSNHKEGLAVDIYDPMGDIDEWCIDNIPALEKNGIWIESPNSTCGWSHWQCVPPRSGKRVFLP